MLSHPSQKKVINAPTITTDNYSIKASNHCGFLGVVLDSKYITHISHLKQKIGYGIQIIHTLVCKPCFLFIVRSFTVTSPTALRLGAAHIALILLQYVQHQLEMVLSAKNKTQTGALQSVPFTLSSVSDFSCLNDF